MTTPRKRHAGMAAPVDDGLSGSWAVAVTMDAVHLIHDGRVMRIPIADVGAPDLYGDGTWLEPVPPSVVEVGEPMRLLIPVPDSESPLDVEENQAAVKLRTTGPVVAAVQIDLDRNQSIVRYSSDATPVPGGSG